MTNDRITKDEGITKDRSGASPSSFLICRSSLRRQPKMLEQTLFWLFRVATYLILAAASYIFLDIGIKGGRTVFTTKPPFINMPFLTESPQTLYLFDFEAKKMALGDREFRQWKMQHPSIEP